MTTQCDFKFAVEPDEAGTRLDAFLSNHLPECSRSFAAALIRQGIVMVDGIVQKPGYRVRPLQKISGCLPPPVPVDLVPEDIPLDIIYQDADIMVINKPAGLVVHPAAGHAGGTLVNALLFHCPSLEGIGGEQRPGIVHRLDKDTSGLLVVAKNNTAHQSLSAQFKQRRIRKIYWALVAGNPERSTGCLEGRIDLPIGRHPTDRKKMSTLSATGRSACTLWKIKESLHGAAWLEIDLKTGRTHQVRVHCQALGHPVVGDPVYGRRRPGALGHKADSDLQRILQKARRQMLHAHQLTFSHPQSGEPLTFKAPMPEDMQALLEQLRAAGTKA